MREFTGRGGHLERFDVRPEGLYAEAVLYDGDIGETAFRMAQEGEAGWSSGAFPGHIRVRTSDGYVMRWGLAEGSVCDLASVASDPGIVRLSAVRQLGEKEPDDELERSIWVVPNLPEKPSQESATAIDYDRLADEVARRIQPEPMTPPVRSLPQGGRVPIGGGNIRVQSDWDGMSILAHALLEHQRTIHAPLSGGKIYKPSNESMRSLTAKVQKAWENQESERVERLHADLDIQTNPFRMVDERSYETFRSRVPGLRSDEAMQSDLSGFGDELVPTLLSSALWYSMRLENPIFQLIRAFQMPSDPFNYPVMGSIAFRKLDELRHRSQLNPAQSPYADTKPATSQITFSTGGLGIMVISSRDLWRKSGLFTAEAVARRLVMDANHELNYLLMHGDESATATNISYYGTNPTGTAADRVLAIDGLRKIAVDNSNTAANATLENADMSAQRQKLGPRGIWGIDPTKIVMVVDPGTYYKATQLTDYKTVDVIGEQAYNKTGRMELWDGVRVIASEDVPLMDSSGYINATGGSNTTGSQLLFRPENFLIGMLRDVEVISKPTWDELGYVSMANFAFDVQQMEDDSVTFHYNTTV